MLRMMRMAKMLQNIWTFFWCFGFRSIRVGYELWLYGSYTSTA